MLIGAKFGKIDVVDANDFAAGGIDDLLVEKILLHGKPGFIGLIGSEGAFGGVEIDASGRGFGDLIIARDERLKTPAGNQEMGHAIRLFGGLDEEFADTADVIRLRVISSRAH